jgi:hypothetical protein
MLAKSSNGKNDSVTYEESSLEDENRACRMVGGERLQGKETEAS